MITQEPIFVGEPPHRLARFGRKFMIAAHHVGVATLMILKAFAYMPWLLKPRYRRMGAEQFYFTGIRSLGVLSVVAMFTGMIFAVQIGLELQMYHAEENVAAGVMVTMLREMGPFMTALIIAASVGSAIAAQIGTMTVSEEIAALEIMAIDPIRFLVMPRLAALSFLMPILTVFTDMLAFFGAAVVSRSQFDVPVEVFVDVALDFATNKDLYVGLFKAWIFGIIICAVACFQGFYTRDGAVGVGRATRKTVVVAFLTILVTGFIITRLFYG